MSKKGGYAYGVRAYVGMPGSGKSYAMAVDCYNAFKAGKAVYSNYLAFGKRLATLADVLELENGVVAIDEANLWLPSRAWAKIPPSLLWKLGQVRKFGLELWYSTQNMARIDKVLREITFEFYHMQSFCKLGFFTVAIRDNGGFLQSREFRKFSIPTADSLYGSYSLVALPEWVAKKGVGAAVAKREKTVPVAVAALTVGDVWEGLLEFDALKKRVAGMTPLELTRLARAGVV